MTGPAKEVGPASWGGLIEAFPDLKCEIHKSYFSDEGKSVFVDVDIGGTQSKDIFGIENKGLPYKVRHLFIFEFDELGLIRKLTSFWDNALFLKQLGCTYLK